VLLIRSIYDLFILPLKADLASRVVYTQSKIRENIDLPFCLFLTLVKFLSRDPPREAKGRREGAAIVATVDILGDAAAKTQIIEYVWNVGEMRLSSSCQGTKC